MVVDIPTKRFIVGRVSDGFDPVGFASPFKCLS